MFNETFAPVGEVRAGVNYVLTHAISVQCEYNTMMGTGVSRASRRVRIHAAGDGNSRRLEERSVLHSGPELRHYREPITHRVQGVEVRIEPQRLQLSADSFLMARSGLRGLQLSQFFQFALQPMTQGAFQPQFIQQRFGLGECFLSVAASLKQGLPTSGNFFFGQHAGDLVGEGIAFLF